MELISENLKHLHRLSLFCTTAVKLYDTANLHHCHSYRGADTSLARPGRKQANVSVRMAWISFGALPCKKKKTWWQLASRCCRNQARPCHASELVSFLVRLRDLSAPRYIPEFTSPDSLKYFSNLSRRAIGSACTRIPHHQQPIPLHNTNTPQVSTIQPTQQHNK